MKTARLFERRRFDLIICRIKASHAQESGCSSDDRPFDNFVSNVRSNPSRTPFDKKERQKRWKSQINEAEADSASQSRGYRYAEEAPRGEYRGPSWTSHDAPDIGDPAEPRLKELPVERVEPRGADIEEAAAGERAYGERAYNADEADYNNDTPDDEHEQVNEKGDHDHEAPDRRQEESRKSGNVERDDEAPTAPSASSTEDGRAQRTDPPEWQS